MKVAAYIRTGSKNHVDENLRKQMKEIKAYISEMGWKLEGVYADVGSGINKNKNLRSMCEDAAEGKFHIIVATEPSRLFRSTELFSEIKNLRQRSKTHIVTTDSTINTFESNDNKSLNIYGTCCVQELEMMSKRIKHGKKVSTKSNS